MNESVPFPKEFSNFSHVPVLSEELIQGLSISPQGYYLDATVGGGGHSASILTTFPSVRMVAIDRDEWAIAAARERLREYGEDRVEFWQGNFAEYPAEKETLYGVLS
jgi:16S rRNA (cytosine1402-N4)-methyltransferase